MRLILLPLLFLSLKLISAEVTAGSLMTPPNTSLKGCPCLECPYFMKGQRKGIWKAKKETPLFDSAGDGSPPVSNIQPGERVVALGGELQVSPGEMEVVFTSSNFRKGQKVYIIQEDADAGAWKLWVNGKEVIRDLSSMINKKDGCKIPSEVCWAKVVKPLASVWWVNIQTKGQKIGWTKQVDDFDFDRSSCM